jgi:hypothetical protein
MQGHHTRAAALAEEAVSIVSTTDHLNMRADALVDLAVVRRSAGDGAAATRAFESAVELYREKENVAAIELARRITSREEGRPLARPPGRS